MQASPGTDQQHFSPRPLPLGEKNVALKIKLLDCHVGKVNVMCEQGYNKRVDECAGRVCVCE